MLGTPRRTWRIGVMALALAGCVAVSWGVAGDAAASRADGSRQGPTTLRGSGKRGEIELVVTNAPKEKRGIDWVAFVPALLAGLFALAGGIVSARYARAAQRSEQASRWQTDSDKSLLEKRADRYEKLIALLGELPKYPEPKRHTTWTLLALSESLTNWYFGFAGGLYLEQKVREAYFDLQDGIKVAVLRMRPEARPEALKELTNVAGLKRTAGDEPRERDPQLSRTPPQTAYDEAARTWFERGAEWIPPSALGSLLTLAITPSDDVSPEVTELLRGLGSSLRTTLTKDLESRRVTSRVSRESA